MADDLTQSGRINRGDLFHQDVGLLAGHRDHWSVRSWARAARRRRDDPHRQPRESIIEQAHRITLAGLFPPAPVPWPEPMNITTH